MSTWRAAGIAFAVILVLIVAYAGQVATRQHPENVRRQGETVLSERSGQRDAKPAADLPSEDAPGRDVPDLPRYPGSVRVEYERREIDALVLTRARYLSDQKIDTIRGFYRSVIRSEGWRVANAEFSDGEWTFLVVKGGREAEIEVRAHDASSETEMRLIAPQPREQPDNKAASEASLPKSEAPPEPTPSLRAAPAPAAPATVPPAPAPGGYEYEEDDSEDFEGEDD